MQIFEPSMRLSTAKASGACGKFLLPIAASLVLAGCGGGSSTSDTPPPPPVVCTATDGGGSGFALGVCADTVTAVFQPVNGLVQPADQLPYLLSLDGPAESQTEFGLDDQTPPLTRDIIGALLGDAYEEDADPAKPSGSLPLPPYTALIDFREARDWNTSALLLSLEFARFGTWERFPTAYDSFFGGWYAGRPGATAEHPNGLRSYAGYAVGVLSPTGPGTGYSRSYGFSATVAVQANQNGLSSGTISGMKISFEDASGKLIVQDFPVNTLEFTNVANFAGQPSTAELVTSSGTGASAIGSLEANFFGSTAVVETEGKEIAGRFRFQTADGKLLGVGAFGVRAPDLQ